jgi:hypothetical protein
LNGHAAVRVQAGREELCPQVASAYRTEGEALLVELKLRDTRQSRHVASKIRCQFPTDFKSGGLLATVVDRFEQDYQRAGKFGEALFEYLNV